MEIMLILIGIVLLGLDYLVIKWILGILFFALATENITSAIVGGLLLYFGGATVIFVLLLLGCMFLWHGIYD